MAGNFVWRQFNQINLSDMFFDSLKKDYPEFTTWFQKKALQNQHALVYNDDYGVGAFLYLKKENVEGDISPLIINGNKCSDIPRLKIGTLRLAERTRKQRLGEGAVGIALWYWRETQYDEIYVTVFEKHAELINLFKRFGFNYIGKNKRGECIYLKNRNTLDYTTPYTCFPFILNHWDTAGIIPINDVFHDRLFPYSELARNKVEIEETTAGNGITKIFIASPYTPLHYKAGMPVFIYRIHTGKEQKAYKSAITSYCTISKVDIIKSNGISTVPQEEFVQQIGNKSVYTINELNNLYQQKKTLVTIEMVYNGYFGKGHNVIYKKLKEQNLFEHYPYNIKYSKEQFLKILQMGDVNVQNTIIYPSGTC